MIDHFVGDYEFLSNFYPCYVTYEGLTFKNSEAAFQAAKATNFAKRKKFCNLAPGEAKRFGRSLRLRDDWEQEKYNIMLEVVRCKFTQNPKLAKKLLATKDEELVEGTYWHDNIWGNCYCKKCQDIQGLNYLGKILMTVRDELKEKTK